MRGVILVAALLAAGAAQAAESSTKPTQPYLDLQPIGMPAVVHGRLVNYVFVDIRLMLGPGVDPSRMQDQEPFLRDTLVKVAGRKAFNPPENGVRMDDARLKAEVMADAAVVFGPGKIVSVQIKSQTPQRRSGVPGGA